MKYLIFYLAALMPISTFPSHYIGKVIRISPGHNRTIIYAKDKEFYPDGTDFSN